MSTFWTLVAIAWAILWPVVVVATCLMILAYCYVQVRDVLAFRRFERAELERYWAAHAEPEEDDEDAYLLDVEIAMWQQSLALRPFDWEERGL